MFNITGRDQLITTRIQHIHYKQKYCLLKWEKAIYGLGSYCNIKMTYFVC